MVCSDKAHDTDEHPASQEPKCVNCKGEHPSNYKACNTRHIRMGLKPIPSTHEKPQQPKSKSKGKEHETNPEEQLNIRLTDKEISNIMKAGSSPQTRKENTAKYIQSQAMDKLIKKPTGKKPQEAPDPADMDVKDAHTQAPSQ